MGVKVLQCFPGTGAVKRGVRAGRASRRKHPQWRCSRAISSTASWGSEGEGGGSLGAQVYFSHKARLSFRHQMDSNINAVDATY